MDYSIRRIRFINFHNFTDECIEINNGGHLFLLGDNGCGKTTVLDAVHYILTGGDLEFNSAARVAGRTSDGRRDQGIVCRYNMNSGALRPQGNISYVAIEVLGRQGKVTTLAVGLSCNGLDDKIQRWGVIRELPLEEIPFIIEDQSGRRASSLKELKKSLKSGVHGHINNYRNQLAERFYTSEENYRHACAFLATGKAYREIVSKSSDYHALFKRLLPEPDTAIFEKITEGLSTLDQAQIEIDNLREKQTFVEALASVIEDLYKALYDEKLCGLREKLFKEEEALCLAKKHQLKVEESQQMLDTTLDEIDNKKITLGHEEKLLENYKNKDSSGLVKQEKDKKEEQDRCIKRLKRVEGSLADEQKKKKQFTSELKKYRQEKQIAIKGLSRRLNSLISFFPSLDLGLVLNGLNNCLSLIDIERGIESIDCSVEISKMDSLRQSVQKNCFELERELGVKEDAKKVVHEQLENLLKSAENCPEIVDFNEAQKTFSSQLIDVIALYQGLEWKAGITPAQKASIEQLIGEDVLATFIVGEDDFDIAAEIVFNHSQLRMSRVTNDEKAPLPQWIKEFFDIEKSNPDALLVLAEEMSSTKAPELSLWHDKEVLGFRAHKRAKSDGSALLIGIEERKRERKRQISLLSSKTKELQKQVKSVENALNSELKKIKYFEELDGLFNELNFLQKSLKPLFSKQQNLDSVEENLCDIQELLNHEKSEFDNLTKQLNQLRELVKKEGLENIEKKIDTCRRRINKQKKNIEDLVESCGRLKTDVENSNARMLEQQRLASDIQLSFKEELASFSDLSTERVRVQMDELCQCQHLHDKEALGSFVRSLQDKVQKNRIKIYSSLNDRKFAAPYGFTYEEEVNKLTTRYGVEIAELCEQQKSRLLEQEEVINEKTDQIFRKLFVSELIIEFKKHINELEDMKKAVNKLLKKRYFGDNCYKIKLEPQGEHKHFLQMLNQHRLLDENSEKELSHFFHEHKKEILNSQQGAVPEMLDYRNWYRFEMSVYKRSSEESEGSVMDRYTKSIGSGGEQAVPNYLLILTIAHFLYGGSGIKLPVLLFDEAFYGIDAGRRDQLLAFAGDIGLQLFVASPDQDGVRQDIDYSTTLLIVKDENYDVHLYPFEWKNLANTVKQEHLFEDFNEVQVKEIVFSEELL